VLRLQHARLVIEHPVADVLDAGFGEIVDRVERLREPRPERAARPLPLNLSITSIVLKVLARWSSSLCIGSCSYA